MSLQPSPLISPMTHSRTCSCILRPCEMRSYCSVRLMPNCVWILCLIWSSSMTRHHLRTDEASGVQISPSEMSTCPDDVTFMRVIVPQAASSASNPSTSKPVRSHSYWTTEGDVTNPWWPPVTLSELPHPMDGWEFTKFPNGIKLDMFLTRKRFSCQFWGESFLM